jgi:hypothetical protein
MNLTHLHLLLNHFPTVGTIVAIGLFLVSLIAKNDDLKRTSLGVFFVIALISLPTYVSGNAAQAAIKGKEGVSEVLMARHQDAALLAFVFMQITGLVAWFGLWQYRRWLRLASWNLVAVLVLSAVTFGLMAWAANIGGEIRHPEIRAAEEVTDGTPNSVAASIGMFVVGHPWVWPTSETLHFIGLGLLFGVVLVVNLRMLGMMKSVSFAVLHGFLPLGIFGFGINAVTGMLFFIATPEQYTQNVAFYWKLIFMLLAGVNVLYFTVVDEPWALEAGDDAPLSAKLAAGSAIFLWVGVMYCGRMLPFIGNSF